MVHIIASVAFSMIALAALSLTLWMLAEQRARIVQVLRLEDARGPAMAHRPRPRSQSIGRQALMRPAPLLRAAA